MSDQQMEQKVNDRFRGKCELTGILALMRAFLHFDVDFESLWQAAQEADTQ